MWDDKSTPTATVVVDYDDVEYLKKRVKDLNKLVSKHRREAIKYKEKYKKLKLNIIEKERGPKPAHPSLDTITRLVCKAYNVSKAEIFSNRRGPYYAVPRQHIYLLGKRWTPYSFNQIGDYVNRDHSTVLFGIKAIEKRIRRKEPIPHISFEQAMEMERSRWRI